MDPAHPHDSLFALAFGEPRDAATLLASALPADVAAAIDWSQLQRIDASFADHPGDDAHGDLLFSAPLGGRPVLLYLLLEHKSAPERFAAFQLLRYVVRILERHLAEHPRLRLLPPVLPIVFHHGSRPWSAAPAVSDLVDLGEVPPAVAAFVRRHQPELRMLLDDVAAQSDDGIAQRRLSLVARTSILFLKHLRRATPADLEPHLSRVRDLLTLLLDDPRGSSILAALCFYAAAATRAEPEQVRSAVHRILEPRTSNTIMNGMQKWLLQERTEGKIEGRAEVLLRQIHRRFGPIQDDTRRRVTTATIADLDRWADRILDAHSLDELFAAT